MDAMELNYPVDVSKFRVSGERGGTSSIKRCSHVRTHKGEICFADEIDCVSTLVSSSWDKIPDAELSKQSGCRVEELSQSHDFKGANGRLTMAPELVKVQRRSLKMCRSSSGSSKRQRVAPPEDIVSSNGVTDKLGSSPTKCNSPEKVQMVKQRRKYGSNRNEKRNLRNGMKPKCETFSIKSGLASFGIGAGGSNVLGMYGLKAELRDITKLFDEISINELLDETYVCQSFGKDKGDKTDSANGNFLHSVRKALSVLPNRKPVQPQEIAQIESSPSKELPICPPSTASLAESDVNGDKDDSFPTDILSPKKSLECSGSPETPTNQMDSPSCHSRDILDRLALPPPKDLDSLLLDAAKPSIFSRSTSDLRPGKQIPRQPSLPPFPWSHPSNGHYRTNSDVAKCLISRNTCHGRWVKVAKIASPLGNETDSFTDLDSLTYDQSLVPSISNADSSEKRSLISTEIDSNAPENPKGNNCPRIIAAAQTLCDIATNPLRQNLDGNLRWSKKPSHKATKVCKSKSIEKSEEKYSAASVSRSTKEDRHGADHITPLKRAKIENKKDVKHTMPSPVKSVAETRRSAATVVKQPRPKLRKLMPVDWSRGRDKPD